MLAAVVFVTLVVMDSSSICRSVSRTSRSPASEPALVAFGYGALALLAGAATGSRTVAIGVPAALFAAAYLIVGLAGLVSWLEPFRVVSPLYHATGTHPLDHGLPIANFAILVAWCTLTVLATIADLRTPRPRALTVGRDLGPYRAG